MPRPRKKTFSVSQLACFDTLLSEMATMPELVDFDIETAVITVKQRKPDYTPKPENIKNAILNLKRYTTKNNTDTTEEISKQKMSIMLGISRPTLDKWIKAGVIRTEVIEVFRGIEIEVFTANSILMSLVSSRQ